MIITEKPKGEREIVALDRIIGRRQSRALWPWHGMTESEFRIHKQKQITNLLLWAALREKEVSL